MGGATEPTAKKGWRRRVASLVLLVAVLVVGAKLLGARDKLATANVAYRLGDPPAATALAVEIVPKDGGDAVAVFRTSFIAPIVRHRPRMRPGLYTFRITLEGPAGARTVERTVDVRRDVEVTIDLSSELTAAPEAR